MALQEVKEPVLKVTTIQGLEVSETVPSDGQVLVWNDANQEWEPSEPYAVYA